MPLDPELASLKKTLKEIPFPSRFAVELCAECNLACSMCHHPQMKRPKGVMPFELWRRCADQVAARSPRTEVWFSFCGEPLLEPDLLLEMIAYGRSVGLRSININTNGMLLTPDLDDRILESGIHRIVFGVDGFSKSVFESIRVKADRDVVYGNVTRLLKRRDELGGGPEINVQFVVMDSNEHEVEPFRAFWKPKGATLKIRNQLSWGGKFESSLCVPDDERIPCPWAMTMMHVFWDGRVPRCPGDTEGDVNEEAGNAWHEPLDVLWARLGKFRDLHMSGRYDELPERCHTCQDWMTGAAVREHPETPSNDFVAAGALVR
ncbi:MAG: radical SAM protein [Myxococcota bacterium]|jgi:pyruvate-formate lyase-activating enzyme|nr:radical SAM protein [Myxococcota bacterium]